MDITKVLPLEVELELAEGLNEGHAFNISHCATKLKGHTMSEVNIDSLPCAVSQFSAQLQCDCKHLVALQKSAFRQCFVLKGDAVRIS